MAYDPELHKRFETLAKAAEGSPQDRVKLADNILKDAVLEAACEIVNLSQHADRETTRLAACKIILDRHLPTDGKIPVGDPLSKFLEGIQSKAGSN